ncbi:MAG TPA: bifunctional [glutamate--ammonia ligase]-adenylyl-L-tyrosine phosphorylase/[glutamate--ammonia-ligase] adenylyltransferase [candidate division Zixibacteria bacterium]|nr:bifunctional [glutamate--ammonia ligase]-adenylyl-L-tyrosine phosphorylase/[glutamate--ammonia-ligase] adenylyltransferase [candidate division Zixibacteria bacterium]
MKSLQSLQLSGDDRRDFERLARESPSPDLAANYLLRLGEAGGPEALEKIPPGDRPALVRLLGSSAYLGEVLLREGASWAEVFLGRIRIARKTVADHLAELESRSAGAGSFDEFCAALRRHKQREYLRIGARDLLASVTLEETVRELTALAEAALEASYRFCRREVERDFGRLLLPGADRDNGFVIIGMGKLGGSELNFSSDIDVVFLYESDEGESAGGARGRADARGFFTAVAKKIVQAMGNVTEDGFVFRVDLRLRPLGVHGPLVQSVDSAMLYYESWGQCWERSALIKARAVAGDLALGRRFLKEVEPFVYRRYLDYTTVEELRHLKLRIENELLDPRGKERNIKLGYGGIREIEFFAQALQLVNGGYEPRIREAGTLAALERLAEHGFISIAEKEKLSAAYRFLRQTEHKVQMVQEAHSHSIPEGAKEEGALARRLGYVRKGARSERALFWRDHRAHTAAVRSIFDRLFYGAQKEITGRGASELGSIWNDLDRREAIVGALRNAGFADPERAYENLLAVRDGEVYAPPSPRRLKVMRTLGPALVAEIANSSSPDRSLLNLARFSHRIGGRTGFLTLLAENPPTMRLLITVFADSQFLTDLFLARPELIDVLIRVDLTRLEKSKDEMTAELRAAVAEAGDVEAKLNALRRYRTEEFIRIGLHDLGGAIELEPVMAQLSDLASACLEVALEMTLAEVEERFGSIPGGRFAIVGMGKLGGKELDYNSDLDLVFVYDAPEDARSAGGRQESLSAHEFYVRVGQKLITYLTAATEEGIAYRIDMQLRPSGKAGPLVCSLDAFREYHRTSSLLWERQALIKARFVAGDAALGAAIEEVRESFAFGRGLGPDGAGEIHHLRMRMERELARENEARFNLKKGRGGLVDIEFVTQMLQLAHGYRCPEVRERETLKALKALYHRGILKKPDYALLFDGYLFLRRLDHRLRLERDQSIDSFEREPERLQSIARALGYAGGKKGRRRGGLSAGEKLLKDYEVRRERIRACYERFFVVKDETSRSEAAETAG